MEQVILESQNEIQLESSCKNQALIAGVCLKIEIYEMIYGILA